MIPVCLLPSNKQVLSMVLSGVCSATVLLQAPHPPECTLTLRAGGRCRTFPSMVVCGGSSGCTRGIFLIAGNR